MAYAVSLSIFRKSCDCSLREYFDEILTRHFKGRLLETFSNFSLGDSQETHHDVVRDIFVTL